MLRCRAVICTRVALVSKTLDGRRSCVAEPACRSKVVSEYPLFLLTPRTALRRGEPQPGLGFQAGVRKWNEGTSEIIIALWKAGRVTSARMQEDGTMKKRMLPILASLAVITLLVAGCGGGLSTSEKDYLTTISEQVSQFDALRSDTLAFVQGAVARAPDGSAFTAWLQQWQPISDRYSKQLAALKALEVPPLFQALHEDFTTVVTTYSGTLDAIKQAIAAGGSLTAGSGSASTGASEALAQKFNTADDLFEQIQATLADLSR